MPAQARGPLLTAAATAPRSAWRSRLFWGAAVVILVLDLWSKHAVFAFLDDYAREKGLIGTVDPRHYATIDQFLREAPRPKPAILGSHPDRQVRLVAMLNPGMMWGAFDEHPGVLKLVRPLAVLVIFLLLSGVPAGQRGSLVALGGILGGAIGNIHDSYRYVGVRDFLEVNLEGVPLCAPFPAFNVADAAICVGVAVLALGMMRGAKRGVEEAKAPTAA